MRDQASGNLDATLRITTRSQKFALQVKSSISMIRSTRDLFAAAHRIGCTTMGRIEQECEAGDFCLRPVGPFVGAHRGAADRFAKRQNGRREVSFQCQIEPETGSLCTSGRTAAVSAIRDPRARAPGRRRPRVHLARSIPAPLDEPYAARPVFGLPWREKAPGSPIRGAGTARRQFDLISRQFCYGR